MADAPALAEARPASGHRATDSPRERDAVPALPPSSLPWLRPAMAAIVLALGLLTVVAMIADHRSSPMPHSHLVAVPIAVAILVAMWLVDIAGSPLPRLPRLVFAAVVAAPNLWLVVIGHAGLNLHFLLLLAAWVVLTGSRAEGLMALGLALGTFGVAMFAQAAAIGWIALEAWVSWIGGLLAVWAMARLLVDQQRLLSALRATQAQLTRQATENERLRAEAEERARELEVLYGQAQQAAALEERQRLARDLHDSATQSLYSARLHAEAALRLLASGDTATAAEYMREVKDAARDALAEMRLLIHELRPPVLEAQGLAAALRLRLGAVEGRAGLVTELVVEPEPAERLPGALEQELYRVAQEALNNALKHGKPGRIVVCLRQLERRVCLEIADDGVGFDVAARADGGMGLRGMRERVERLGGRLDIESAPGLGTRVRVEVPR
jgi:signal transduction histidine kinase